MILYLDTSSLVKLYVAEAGSDAVRELVNDATIVATSVIAYPEIRAALSRLRREGSLNRPAFSAIKHCFDQDWLHYLTLDVTMPICRSAGDLAERYRLRGYDSVHLASFIEIARLAGLGETRFSSFDARLNRAAQDLARALNRRR